MKKSISTIILVLAFLFSGCENRIQPSLELREITNIGFNINYIYKTYFKRAFIFQSIAYKDS
ncbi:hypothetical protein LS70_001270 [Helicobacter sp. MIT 11-5569]|uniref:hypothetical protein n=1 Tax=Helicobacter sp. MIT 11-5569 TaxID=1548151 RepID=UPI00051FE8FA|nr:hypothetical protein [Helicobacter sp. MIT 11-5569]TLD85207.1 hypothetical protein LS70_001270 [Helicobacter sp. MIT 11-5569]